MMIFKEFKFFLQERRRLQEQSDGKERETSVLDEAILVRKGQFILDSQHFERDGWTKESSIIEIVGPQRVSILYLAVYQP